MVDNLDYADERSSQHDLEDDEPSSSPAEVATTTSIHPPTMNDCAEPNHTKPSTVQFHKANKEASFHKLKHAENNALAVGAFLKHRHDKVWPTGSAKITPTSKDDDKSYIKSLAKQPSIKRLKARRVLMHPTLDC
ncbi:hypothetical protein DIS24_g11688 [Lasiodiplodia hormozganensis]|uniref:Uncharacterized protein n=1 Tax=Lasiodiplodia hormozganensis TaxID=869390 RepID=A0AA39WNK2_9PEZI|nr:hypothetical protein DIS24_g11688 [Lasiodiplodia hormozganensis]